MDKEYRDALFASILFIFLIDIGEHPLPKKLIPSLAGRTVRCILFDLGDTLWFRKDLAVWQQLENTSNVNAVTLLRQFVAPTYLPDTSKIVLGQHLRASIDEQIHILIRQNPELEPDCASAVLQVLQRWGIDGVSHDHSEAIFEAVISPYPEHHARSLPIVLSTLATLKQRVSYWE
jgi:hypothetical protein